MEKWAFLTILKLKPINLKLRPFRFSVVLFQFLDSKIMYYVTMYDPTYVQSLQCITDIIEKKTIIFTGPRCTPVCSCVKFWNWGCHRQISDLPNVVKSWSKKLSIVPLLKLYRKLIYCCENSIIVYVFR